MFISEFGSFSDTTFSSTSDSVSELSTRDEFNDDSSLSDFVMSISDAVSKEIVSVLFPRIFILQKILASSPEVFGMVNVGGGATAA